MSTEKPDRPCVPWPYSSRTCPRGTYGCDVLHPPLRKGDPVEVTVMGNVAHDVQDATGPHVMVSIYGIGEMLFRADQVRSAFQQRATEACTCRRIQGGNALTTYVGVDSSTCRVHGMLAALDPRTSEATPCKGKIWSCKIGETGRLPMGADAPMRAAVRRAYLELTGEEPAFIFSGWGAELTEPERAVVENRPPRDEAMPSKDAGTRGCSGQAVPKERLRGSSLPTREAVEGAVTSLADRGHAESLPSSEHRPAQAVSSTPEERFERAKKAWKEVTGEDVSHLPLPEAAEAAKCWDCGEGATMPPYCWDCHKAEMAWRDEEIAKLKKQCPETAAPPSPCDRPPLTHVACRDTEGRIWSLPKPHRHHHVLNVMSQHGAKCAEDNHYSQGFLDESGRYLHRKAALGSAEENGQIKNGKIIGGVLTSEDLW